MPRTRLSFGHLGVELGTELGCEASPGQAWLDVGRACLPSLLGRRNFPSLSPFASLISSPEMILTLSSTP